MKPIVVKAADADSIARHWGDLRHVDRLRGGEVVVLDVSALTGVTATNISTKRFAGTSIGFISLFSYVGASVAGKVCGNLAQAFGGWRLPLLVMVATAAVGAAVFLCLWWTRANSYESDGV